MIISYYNIDKEFKRSLPFLNKLLPKFKTTGNFILGNHLENFEKKLSKILGSKYVLGVANGSDALELSISSLEPPPGSEIITTSNTFVSTVNAIINSGCKPVFADIDKTYNIDPEKIEKHITKKTFAIIPVHLNGLPACMFKINKIAKKYKLKVIEDAAQSILSTYDGKYIGNQNNLACFSLHPTKNLGVIGDGGFISTNNKKLYEKLKILRNHGIKNGDNFLVGRNSRLSEINALVASIRLKFLKKDTLIKNKIAKFYSKNLSSKLTIPQMDCCKENTHTFHRYVIMAPLRDKLKNFLKKRNIETKVHYPKNIHQIKVFKKYLKKNTSLKNTEKFSKSIISLPCNHFMNIREVRYITSKINEFYKD